MSERLVECANVNGHYFILSHTPQNNVDANFYVDVGNCYKGKTNTLDIGWFSHIHADDITTVDKVCLSIDYMFHQAQRYIDMLASIYPRDKMSTALFCEADEMFTLTKPVIGVFQRGVFEGKGFNFLLELSNKPLLKKFKFIFVGSGWDAVVNELVLNGVECSYKVDEIYENYPSLYELIDYLLIPSLWEGGPMNAIEAKMKGIPIISSDVGWMGSEFPVEYLFPPNDKTKLIDILNTILTPMIKRRELAMRCSYKLFLDELIDKIKDLKGANDKT